MRLRRPGNLLTRGRGTVSAAPDVGATTEPAASKAAPAPAARTRQGASGAPSTSRLPSGLAAGAAAALPVVALLIALGSAGWAPTGDEAWIAWRSWDVLGGPFPLLGPFTQATAAASSPVFEPGPLLFWLLAVPAHLLPSAGAAVGALGWSTLCIVLACLAAGHAGGARAAWSAAAAMLLLEWSLFALVGEAPVWNAYAGLLPFATLLVVAAVVVTGRVGWLPVVLALGSFLAQTHLMFAPAAAWVLLLSVGSAAVEHRRSARNLPFGEPRASRRWVVLSVLVAAFCWWPAVYQQLARRPGNLTALLHAVLGGGPSIGWRRALGSLGETLGPVPGWLRPPGGLASPTEPSGRAVAAALVALSAVALVGGLAVRSHRRGLAAIAGVAVVSALGACWAIAGIFTQTAGAYAYIHYVTWPVALLMEVALGWGVVLLAQSYRKRRSVEDTSTEPAVRRAYGSRRAGAVAVTVVAAVLLTAGAVVRGPHRAGLAVDQPRGAAIRLADATARLIGPPTRTGERVTVSVAEPGGLTTVALLMATGYRLRTMGWTPALRSPWNQVLDPRFASRPGDPVLGVGPPPSGARLLGTVDVPQEGVGTAVTATRSAPVWLLSAR